MKKLILLAAAATSLFASSSFAELAVGGYLGVNQAQISGNIPDGNVAGKNGSEYGALFLMPFFPTLSLRFSLAQKVRKTQLHDTVHFGVDVPFDVSENLNDFGIGIQWDLPVTDLYVMGGAKISSSQSITCSTNTDYGIAVGNCTKTPTDYPVYVGVGYNLFSLALVHFSFEGEYERGSAASFDGAKNGALTGRFIVKVGL